tara:strand:+ start:1503 stop:1973 length:471 start_codon:yes stop_codon:yes gene_type:complete
MDQPVNKNSVLNKYDLESSLAVSTISLIILIIFLIYIIINFLIIFKNYYYSYQDIYGSSKDVKKKDNYNYNDNYNYYNNYEEILKSIKSIRKDYDREFYNLKNYKKENNLDSKIYGKINTNVLSSNYDNYEYKSKPSIIDFIKNLVNPLKINHENN